MRDESEWRRFSNAFPTSPLRSARVRATVYIRVRVRGRFREGTNSIESSLPDEEHCLRRTLVIL